jgi:hypothetical protein
MKTRLTPALLSGFLVLHSTSLFAHMDHSAAGPAGKLLHLLTGGHHAPLLLLAGIGIAYLAWKRQRTGK